MITKQNSGKTITNLDGISFQQLDGQSVLDASIEAGYAINHSCRSGRCGFCKVQLLAGETQTYRREELSSQELKDNWILTCARTAITDVQIDAGTLSKLEVPKSMNIPCGIADLSLVSSDVLRVTLRLPLVVRFAYLAGQYVDITNAFGITRSYSLAIVKAHDQTIELHIRKLKHGAMSDYWFNQAKVHDLLTLHGPKGTFFWRDVAGKDVYMLATGTGIAPIQAMLAAHQHLPVALQAASITVIWGGRKPEDFYLDVQNDSGNVTFIPTLSVNHPAWSGAYGYVQDVLLSLNPNMDNARVYACGSPLMIDQAQQKFLAQGLNPQHFLADAFVSSGN